MNLSRVSGVANLGDGVFAFREDVNFVPGSLGGTFTNPGMGTNVGEDFLRDVVTPPTFTSPFVEGLAVSTQQDIQNQGTVISAAQIAELDNISSFAAGFTGEFSDGGFTLGKSPTGPGALPVTGDFSAGLRGTGYVLAVQVPEPGTLSIFGIAALCGIGYRQRQRNRA